MLKKIGQSALVQRLVGEGLALWLRFIRVTSRFSDSPADLYGPIRAQYPYIVAMWHGQHFLVPFMRREGHEFRILISRHGDGEINAVAVTRLGLGLIRGSGGKATRQFHKGGPAIGVFLQLTAQYDDAHDLAIPGRPFTFGQFIQAQAAGDASVLADRGRPVLTLTLRDVAAGAAAVTAALG